MYKVIIIINIFILLCILLFYVTTNYSFTITYYINILYFNINFNFTAMWFIFFMGVLLFIFIFLLSKKIISINKLHIILKIYILIFMIVSLIIIIEDFVFFMILFESLFFPICFISLFFSFNNRFIFAIYYLIIFSSFSSILCITLCIIIIFHFNTINLIFFTDICYFDNFYLNIFLWLLLFIMFSIKYPIWPLHVWLPEVHVEVNTEMSALLASIVLKIGFFGVYKFIYLALNYTSIWFIGCIDSILIIGLLFISLTLLFLSDYKKIIAHWSVIHTGIGLILLWHNDLIFTNILFFCNLGHILSSGFMFIIIGYMYDNYGMRIFLLLISFFGISIWSSIFIGLFLFNIDFPFMLLFIIDLFVLYGLLTLSFLYIIIFFIIIIIVFTSSIYIYMLLSFFSFIWLDKYLRIDLAINDILIFFIISLISFHLFFLIFYIFI